MEYLLGNAWIWKEVELHITSRNEVVFVLGATGVGKTYTVKQICQHYGIDVFYIDSTTCGNAKEFTDIITKQMQTRMIQSLAQDAQRRKVVVVDELETLMQFDRGIIGAIQNIQSHIRNPVVCIGHKSLEKKITQAFPKCSVYCCTAPSEADICIWMKQIAHTHVPCDKLVGIAEKCNGNLHYAIQLLSNDTCTQDQQLTFDDIYTVSNKEQIRNLLHDDIWLNPLRFHENLPNDMSLRQGSQMCKNNMYFLILQFVLEWDAIMSASHHDVALEIIIQLIVILNTLPRKKGKQLDNSNFTKLFSNLSLQKKNEKKMYSTDCGFPWAQAQIFCDYIKYR